MFNRLVDYLDPELDATYSAIAHGVRRELLHQLRPGEAKVTELAAPFNMSLAAVSKHIRVLEEAGLVQRSVRGREHIISLEPSPLLPAAGWLEDYRRFWESRLDTLEARLRQREAR
jgi:DNA-binding transcriptional ArsR family regulator